MWTIKHNEIINNHELEHEDAFMIQLKLNSDNKAKAKTSIDVMNDFVINEKEMTIKDFEKIHRLLIRGTTDDIEKNYPIRTFETSVCEVSINLGVFNLIPFPALDGGRFLFLIIEGIRRKPLNRNVEAYVNFVGIIILFAFMIFVTVKDVFHLFS